MSGGRPRRTSTTRQRSPLGYLVKLLTDYFERSLREE